MSWLIFAMCLLFVSAVDSYFTRRREAQAKAHSGAHAADRAAPQASAASPASAAPTDPA